MNTNTNAAQVANNLIAVAEDQAFEAWYKQDCLVGGVNARIAARAAWNARAALTTAAAVPPEGVVMVPVELANRVQESLGEFLMDHGWSQRDMDTSDDFGAVLLAAAPKAEPVPAAGAHIQQESAYTSVQLAEMVLSDCGHSSNYKPLLERVAGRIDRHVERLLTVQQADRAMRKQAAPQPAVQQGWDIDAAVEKAWGRFQAAMDKDEPLPPPSIHATAHYGTWLGREAHRHDEPKAGAFRNAARMLAVLEAEIRRLHAELIAAQPAAPVAQGDAQPMQPSDDDVICPSCSHQFRAIPVNVQKLMLDAGIAPPFTSSAQKDVAMDTFQKNGIAWAVDRWKSEVMNRPMRNLHRRSLDDAWRQVVRYFGGCPDTLLGPCHDASRAQAKEGDTDAR